MGLIDTSFLTNEGRQRGTDVHAALEKFDHGTLGEPDEWLLPWLAGWEQFCADYEVEHVSTEEICHNPTWWYAGIRDRKSFVKGTLTAIELKTGAKEHHHVAQTWAYADAEPKVTQGIRVYLRPENKGKKYNVDFCNDVRDRDWFRHMSAAHNGKIKNEIWKIPETPMFDESENGKPQEVVA